MEGTLVPRPPEAQVIFDHRTKAGLSIREAARRASVLDGLHKRVSEGSWRRTEGDRPVKRTAVTLARMGLVVGVTPEEFEQAGRPDAAATLRHLQERGFDPLDQLAHSVRDSHDLTERQKNAIIDLIKREQT